jgi:hypothetical protein
MSLYAAVVGFLLASAPILDAQDLDNRRGPPRVKPRKRPDQKTVQTLVTELVRLVAAFDAMPELSRSKIESVLGAKLGPSTAEPPNPDGYNAVLTSGPLGAVSFRHSSSGRTPAFAILVLDLREDLKLERQDLDARLIGPRTGTNAQMWPTTFTHGLSGPGWRRLFVFESGSGALARVSFLRGSAARAP